MAWLDDRVRDHPKFVGLDPRAFQLWVHALCYCSQHGTGGSLDAAIAALRIPKTIVRELVKRQIWDEEDGGFWVHDWQEHNEKRDAARDEKREQARARQRKHREKVKASRVTPRDESVTVTRDNERDVTRDVTRDKSVTVLAGARPPRARDHDHDQEEDPKAVTSTYTPDAPGNNTNGLGFTEDEQEQQRRAAELIEQASDEPWF